MSRVLRQDWILLRRDLILHRRALVAVALIHAAFQVYFVIRVNHPTLWLVFTCIYVSFLTVMPLNREDRFGTLAWSCTLPVSRADLVRGYYLTAWALLVGSFVVALGLAAFVPGSKLSALMFLSPDRLLLAAGITTFLIALLLPFTIRFGFMGVVLVLAVLQIVGALTLMVGVTTGRMGNVESAVGGAIRALAAGITALRHMLSTPVFRLALLAALVLVNWISYRFASAILRRRDL